MLRLDAADPLERARQRQAGAVEEELPREERTVELALGEDARGGRHGRKLHFRPLGAIAQLGERLDRTQEVAGSSPASSIAYSSRFSPSVI